MTKARGWPVLALAVLSTGALAVPALADEAGDSSFADLVRARCLPAIFEGNPLQVGGLTALDKQAASFFIGDRPGTVYAPAVPFLVLYDIAETACSVQYYDADPESLLPVIRAWMAHPGYGFQLDTSEGNDATRLSEVFVSDRTDPPTKVLINSDTEKNLMVVSVIRQGG
ncbi:MAG: hypothetical protein AAGF74_04670 [Pseudomonadota bacterium]